ncbi:MAG: hypothetical protein Q9218_000925 [Villophora microphyllina]
MERGQVIALTAPLHEKGRTKTRFGYIDDKDVLGKQPRDVVTSSKNSELRVQVPTLEEYVVLASRLVTPIYPADANLIVSLLDLHPHDEKDPVGSDAAIQILEAGTGHGGLTLHLARAIHAANVGLDFPSKSTRIARQEDTRHSPSALWRHVKEVAVDGWTRMWRGGSTQPVSGTQHSRRRAVIHTVDVSPGYARFAAKNVENFRKGMYMRNIDFHVGDVSDWIEQHTQANRQEQQFLSHAVLDLPSSHTHIEKTVSALQVNGKLLVFNPSITQINSVVELVKTRRLPLQLEKVIEIGPAMTGGRLWSVRHVKPRALTKETSGRSALAVSSDERHVDREGQSRCGEANLSEVLDDEYEDQGWQLVCRPKPGERVSGGGFVALWSRNRTRNDA